MQDRETAHRLPLEFALSQLRHGYQQLHEHRVSRRGMREFADGIIAPAIRRMEQALASPLSAPPQEPTGASPQAEELRAANVANLREMVGMAGRYRETLLAVRECILALSPGHRTGYDWNADPLFLTLKEGRALNLIDDALKATPASPQAETSANVRAVTRGCHEIGGDDAGL